MCPTCIYKAPLFLHSKLLFLHKLQKPNNRHDDEHLDSNCLYPTIFTILPSYRLIYTQNDDAPLNFHHKSIKNNKEGRRRYTELIATFPVPICNIRMGKGNKTKIVISVETPPGTSGMHAPCRWTFHGPRTTRLLTPPTTTPRPILLWALILICC